MCEENMLNNQMTHLHTRRLMTMTRSNTWVAAAATRDTFSSSRLIIRNNTAATMAVQCQVSAYLANIAQHPYRGES